MRLVNIFVPLILLIINTSLIGQALTTEAIENYRSKGACEMLESHLPEMGESAEIQIAFGRCLTQTDRFEEAIDHYKAQKELLNENADYHFWYGQAYLAKLNSINNFVEKGIWASRTKTKFQKAVELNPDHLDARESLARYYLNAPAIAGGSKKKARQQIDEIKMRDPARGYGLQARLYTQEKKYEDAKNEYLKYLEISKDTVEVYYQIGFNHQTEKQYHEALEAFQVSITAGSDYNKAYYQYARTAIFSESNLGKALEYINHFIDYPAEDGPEVTHAYWRKGMIYQLMGDQDAAKKWYIKALELDPDNQYAIKSLQELNQ